MCHIEAEERAQADQLLATTEELEKARSRIRSMEQDVEKARVEAAKMVIEGPKQPEPMAPVSVQINKMLVIETVSKTNKAQEQELAKCKEDLVSQEALRSREQELKKVAEEEQWKTVENVQRAEESLRKGH